MLSREACVALAGALLLLPLVGVIATAETLGLQDLPWHLLVARLAAMSPEELPAGVVHTQVSLLSPYRLIYTVLALGGPGRELAAARALLLAYLIATAIALLAIAHQFPSWDPWPVVAGIPLAVSAFFWSGFIVYLLALPVFLWLVWAELRRFGPLSAGSRRRYDAFIALSLVLLYLLHPLVLLLGVWVSLSAMAIAWRKGQGQVRCPRIWPGLLGLSLATIATGLVLRGAFALGGNRAPGGDSFVERASLLLSNTFAHFGPPWRTWAILGTALMLAGLLSGSRVVSFALSGSRRAGSGAIADDRGLLLLSAWGACATATLTLPFFAGPLAYAGTRFALPTLLLGAAILAGPLARGRADPGQRSLRRCSALLVVAGAAVLSLNTAAALRSVSREIAPLLALGRTLAGHRFPPHVVRITFEPRSQAVPGVFCLGATAHVYALLEAGGADAELFHNPFLPVTLNGEYPRAPNVFQPQHYHRKRHARGATHVLLRLPGVGVADTADSRLVVSRLRRDFALEALAGPWSLWKRLEPPTHSSASRSRLARRPAYPARWAARNRAPRW